MLKSFIIFIMFCAWASYVKGDVTIHFTKLVNFKPSEITKITKAGGILEEVVNSQEFKNKVLNHSYNGKKQFVDTALTNEQVYEKVMKGAESYKKEDNGKIDISLTMYYSSASTIGYTTAGSDMVFLNRKFHDTYDSYEQTSNLYHEWTHKLGFEHAQKWSKPRDYSVPYALGSIVKELSASLKANPKALTAITAPTIPEVEIKTPEVQTPTEVKNVVCTRSWKTLWLVRTCR